ncbi:unnamed protein product [Acanthosepion pharaonis]|uniref:Uncharacterized protein n=1 Tax=Acanthosepion pharaonis TaxID=158019 RepID=A0A812CZ38_ACAPH|nr:unnamed protein product [Sepia pharaonis]
MNSTLDPTLLEDAGNNTMQGLPMSTKLTIGVLAGVAAFGLIIIIIVLVCLLVQSKKSGTVKKAKSQNSELPASHTQMTPYHGHFRSSNDIPPAGAYPPDGNFREYDNWAYTAGTDELSYYPDVISDLNRKSAIGNKDLRWATVSLRAHDNYDYARYGRIPRAKLYERKEDLTS